VQAADAVRQCAGLVVDGNDDLDVRHGRKVATARGRYVGAG
jgi:hypothetical protein